MTKTSLKEFLNTLPTVDQTLLQTITALSEAHPVIRTHSIIQNVLKDQINQISFHDLSCVLRSILQRCVQLAHDMPKASAEEKALIIAEQNVLNMSASILSFSMTSRLQNTINNLSQIARGTSLRK